MALRTDQNLALALIEAPFLPLEVYRRLLAFCQARDEDPSAVLHDAVALYIDQVE